MRPLPYIATTISLYLFSANLFAQNVIYELLEPWYQMLLGVLIFTIIAVIFFFLQKVFSWIKSLARREGFTERPDLPLPTSICYETALKEIYDDDVELGIWAKAYSEAIDEESAKKLYVKYRAEEIYKEFQEEHSDAVDKMNARYSSLKDAYNWTYGLFGLLILCMIYVFVMGDRASEFAMGVVGLVIIFFIFSIPNLIWKNVACSNAEKKLEKAKVRLSD